ncbi:hypothetical protein A3709_17805 [Halioglobus sp. HI00S01]|uniref:hypothetical protein n=1 Tax=Halioglobus sp. HI00S01 TaxID=1822214 RepID=UPI0007C3924B|nr:hypothetical protein [Halioglobus sp. HI00S01]KZX58842.1 hypothetical protein A3709_17805 [Halioglobus sp. HI00S01]
MKHLITSVAIALSLAFAQSAAAAAEATGEAALIVYRFDKNARSHGIKVDVRADHRNEGRIATGEVIVITRDAGTVQFGSSLPNSPAAELKLKPGQVHYVEYSLTVRNTRSKLEVREVGEQVAKLHLDELPESTI